MAIVPRRLYKDAEQKALNAYVKDALSEGINPVTHLDEYTSRFIKIVDGGIESSIPFTNASPYNKK